MTQNIGVQRGEPRIAKENEIRRSTSKHAKLNCMRVTERGGAINAAIGRDKARKTRHRFKKQSQKVLSEGAV